MLRRHTRVADRRGMAAVVSMIFVVLLATLAAGFVAGIDLGLIQSDNGTRVMDAGLTAESGLAFTLYQLESLRLPNDTTIDTLLPRLRDALATQLAPSVDLAGQSTTYADGTVTVPAIPLGTGSFTSRFYLSGPAGQQKCCLRVTGNSRGVARTILVTFLLTEKSASVFNFGVASRGRIVVNGSALLTGVNDPSEASVLSTRSEPVAIQAGGHATITGDLYVTGADASYVVLQGGGLTIGGESDLGEIMADHVYLGAEEPDFPPIDTAQFASLPTTIIDSTTPLGGTTFNNIRIKAGTDPTFAGGTTINGIIYVEKPNKVKFAGGVTIKGLIVTEDGSSCPPDSCQIDFRGNVSAPGVGALPDTDQFRQIRTQTGSFLLAPGFGATFRGSVSTINGTIAADQISFSGASSVSGSVTGSILGLKDNPMTLSGNATIRINKKDADLTPAGFRHPMGLTIQADSYTEVVGQ